MKELLKKCQMLFVLVCTALPGAAQFYNGHQMSFGKNRVQYNEFVWSYNRYDKYDVYFNEEGKSLANYTADYAARVMPRIEAFFDYTMEKRVLFVVYNRLTDYRQSNIGLVTGQDEYNIGGTTTVVRNKAFLYFEGDYREYDKQITAAVTRIIINELLFGSQLMDNVANSTLISIPKWYSEGLVAYLSDHWDIETENHVRDGIISGKYEKFNRLTGQDAIYAGHSFWKYIADTYGESVIPSILYLTSVSKSIKTGFSNVLGFSVRELSYDWTGYYMNLFADEQAGKAIPESPQLLKRSKKGVVYQRIRISPSGNYLSFVTNDKGLYKIWLYNMQTSKKKRIFKHEYRLDQITDYSFPVVAWHPSARYLAFFTEEKGMLKLYYYNLAERKLTVRNFLYFDKVLDFSFSNEGSRFVFTGTRMGKTDIYVYDIPSSTSEQVTNDFADDNHPRFVENDSKIIFNSDRISDTLGVQEGEGRAMTNDLFIYDYKSKSPVLMRLQDGKYIDKAYPLETEHNQFIQLSDASGINNRYIAKFDSTISQIDTTIHYRYFAKTNQLSDYTRNIEEQDYNPTSGNVADIFFHNGRYRMFHYPLDILSQVADAEPTPSQKQRIRMMAATDSLRNIKKEVIPIQEVVDNTIIDKGDTVVLGDNSVDINKYVFEIERINNYNARLDPRKLEVSIDTVQKKRPRIRLYQPVFYQNSMVSQIDFNFLNASYQAFTGGAFYFNPGLNVLFKVGANDLFEDLKITGGFRLSPDFDANEYLLSFENLKKRTDKQLVLHRQAFKNTGYGEFGAFEIRTHTHQASMIFRYPINQVKAVATTFSFRNDRTVFLSSNPSYLNEPNQYRNWLGVKFEYVFDNTQSLGMNLYSGTRYKLFAEFQEQIYKEPYDLVVFGADFRHYTRIHRSLILANRFAWSSSQGSSRIIYYLGGVDNWINLTPSKTPTFIPFTEIPIDETQNYAFQAVGTDMRGFSQNIRNGNNFAIFNTELRFPVFKYLANYPLARSFFENFQVVGFFDVGSAWSGPSPWSSRNAYDNDIIQQGPITITIDADRNPIVAGYGFGIHTQLLGYFMRFDWAWGIENHQILPHVFYFSTSLDF